MEHTSWESPNTPGEEKMREAVARFKRSTSHIFFEDSGSLGKDLVNIAKVLLTPSTYRVLHGFFTKDPAFFEANQDVLEREEKMKRFSELLNDITTDLEEFQRNYNDIDSKKAELIMLAKELGIPQEEMFG